MMLKKLLVNSLLVLAILPAEVSQAYPKLKPQQMKCLADNVYYEARGEPNKGQMLVARVTLNRAKLYHNGDICKAVYAKNQFSWTLKRQSRPEPEVYANAAKAAYAALWYYKPVYYFHSVYVRPPWAAKKKIVTKVGNHIFYET